MSFWLLSRPLVTCWISHISLVISEFQIWISMKLCNPKLFLIKLQIKKDLIMYHTWWSLLAFNFLLLCYCFNNISSEPDVNHSRSIKTSLKTPKCFHLFPLTHSTTSFDRCSLRMIFGDAQQVHVNKKTKKYNQEPIINAKTMTTNYVAVKILDVNHVLAH